jgi:hypothetical protein
MGIRGFMAGVQAALLSLVAVVIPAVAAFTATSAAEVNNGVSWLDAARAATDFWLLGHGGALTVGTTPGAPAAAVTVIPLGVAVFSVLSCRFLARVSSAGGWWLVGFGVLGYAAMAWPAMGIFATSASRPSVPAGVAGAIVASAAGFAWGNRGGPPLVRLPAATPPWVRAVPGAAGLIAAVSLAGATVVSGVWAVAGYGRFFDLTTALDAGILGGIVMSLVCLAFFPNMVAYALTYCAGTGFSIGTGTLFSPAGLRPGPVPALPLLGILPTTAPPAALWVVGIPVVAGALGGLWLRRRLPDSVPWWTMAATALVSSLAAAAGLACVVIAASGAAGPGTMTQVGAGFRPVFFALAAEIGTAAVTVAVVSRAQIALRLYDATHPERPIKVTGRPSDAE